jgi:hypothetical protein
VLALRLVPFLYIAGKRHYSNKPRTGTICILYNTCRSRPLVFAVVSSEQQRSVRTRTSIVRVDWPTSYVRVAHTHMSNYILYNSVCPSSSWFVGLDASCGRHVFAHARYFSLSLRQTVLVYHALK